MKPSMTNIHIYVSIEPWWLAPSVFTARCCIDPFSCRCLPKAKLVGAGVDTRSREAGTYACTPPLMSSGRGVLAMMGLMSSSG